MNLLRSKWIKHGFLNTLEHGITRIADGLTTLVLVWALDPEVFSRLALAQAAVAPLLLFFISPETILYRDYARWADEGASSLAGRISVFRKFGYGKAQLALLISAGLGFVISSRGGVSYYDAVCGLIWAFALALAPQVSGADREYLRLSLQLRSLNKLSTYQKLTLFLGTAVVSSYFNGNIQALMVVAVFSAGSTAFFARSWVNRYLLENGAKPADLAGRTGPSVFAVLSETLRGFSIWQHLQGIVLNWVQTMDLFCLGLWGFPAREVGLYAAALKLVNFTNFAPLALTNIFGVWIGRRAAEDGHTRELRELRRYSALLAMGVAIQGVVFYFLSPWLISLLSRGRWSSAEQAEMVQWFGWVLVGNMILSSTHLRTHWLHVRTNISQLFMRVYLPWGALAFLLYWLTAGGRIGLSADSLLGVSRMNVGVALIFVGLLGIHMIRLARGIVR